MQPNASRLGITIIVRVVQSSVRVSGGQSQRPLALSSEIVAVTYLLIRGDVPLPPNFDGFP
jgi:hypothetical protein